MHPSRLIPTLLAGALLMGCPEQGTETPTAPVEEVSPTQAPTATADQATPTSTDAPEATATAASTAQPTDPPTAAPTAEPTAAPTAAPTDPPEMTPTAGSTPAPTSTPEASTPPAATDAPTAPASTPTPGAGTPPPATDAPTAPEPTDAPTATEAPTPTATRAPTPTPTADPATIDHDGDGYSEADGDCDDQDADVNPGATEVCDNSQDDDCQGGDLSCADVDDDGDGYTENDGDCDDGDSGVYPGAPEVCDGADQDCDGVADQPAPVDGDVYYPDDDGDGFGDADGAFTWCGPAPDGAVSNADDCDDDDAAVFPGTAASCPAGESCLNVLELGLATGSGLYWIDPPNKDAYEEYCDFGTIGEGWTGRMPITYHNDGDALTEHWAPVLIDTDVLIDAGELGPRGDDLRVGTHDGPLLKYWYDGAPADGPTVVWILLPEVPAGGDLPLTLFFGNPDTERRSIAWLFEDFSADRSDRYTNVYDLGTDWVTPHWTWNTDLAALQTDNSNADYFLLPNDLPISLPIYVETWAITTDNDAYGVVMTTDDGALYCANVADDYNGIDNGHTEEGIIRWASVPKNHRQATTVLNLGNLAAAKDNLHRVGLGYDGQTLTYHLDGQQRGMVAAADVSVANAGVASLANSETASLYARYSYLWVGSEPITFNPLELTSPTTSEAGAAGPF